MQTKFETLQIIIAEGRKESMRFADNRTMTWPQFCAKMSKPLVTVESVKEFDTYNADEQNNLKKEAGWIMGGEIRGRERNNTAIISRSVISIDCDKLDLAMFESIKNGQNPICKFEFFWHTTRKNRDDSPRIRIFLPVTAPIIPAQFNAVSQLVAQIIDETGDSIDAISFRKSQLMFNPTCSNGQKFDCGINNGVLINPDEILAEFGDKWKDHAQLPFAKGSVIPKTSEDGVACPYEKTGIIGSFCRVYKPIQRAIAEFVPEIYIPGTGYSATDRFTYAPGETANGVTIQEDGRFIYSFHGSDPCAGRLFNAFDMVRKLKFGHLDAGIVLKTDYKTWPSFRAMLKFAESIAEVKSEALSDRIDFPAMVNDADENQGTSGEITTEQFLAKKPKPPKKSIDWIKKNEKWVKKNLKINNAGEILASYSNITLIMMHDPRLAGKIALNTFTGKMVALEDIKTSIITAPEIEVVDKKNGDDWTELGDIAVQAILDWHGGKGMIGWGVSASKPNIMGAIRTISSKNKFDPVIDYYEGLEWDEKPRVENLFVDYMGVDDNAYHTEAAKLFILGAICRSYNPGHKFDHAVILQGKQGVGKSTFPKNLFGHQWFGELTTSMVSDKNAVEQMQGKKCLELPELSHMRKQEVDEVKSFITRQIEEVRLTYDKRMTKFPRRCVFMGTTNRPEYLKDPTGNRRFWPVKVLVDMIDNYKLDRERDQIWAEGMVMYAAMIKKFGKVENVVLKMTKEAEQIAEMMQDGVTEEHGSSAMLHYALEFLDNPAPISVIKSVEAMAGTGADHIAVRTSTTAIQIAEGLGYDKRQIERDGITRKIGKALQLVDHWNQPKDKSRPVVAGVRGRIYHRKGATPEEIALGYKVISKEGDPPFPVEKIPDLFTDNS